MCICKKGNMYTWLYVWTAFIDVCIKFRFECYYVYVWIHTWMHESLYVYIICMNVCMYVCKYVCMYLCVYVYVDMFVDKYVDIYVWDKFCATIMKISSWNLETGVTYELHRLPLKF